MERAHFIRAATPTGYGAYRNMAKYYPHISCPQRWDFQVFIISPPCFRARTPTPIAAGLAVAWFTASDVGAVSILIAEGCPDSNHGHANSSAQDSLASGGTRVTPPVTDVAHITRGRLIILLIILFVGNTSQAESVCTGVLAQLLTYGGISSRRLKCGGREARDRSARC
jgi:hypothetical protein